MDYYTSWTISSVAKLITAAMEKTGKTGGLILTAGIVAGGYLSYKKIKKLEDRITQLEFKVQFERGR